MVFCMEIYMCRIDRQVSLGPSKVKSLFFIQIDSHEAMKESMVCYTYCAHTEKVAKA